jgi:hypothetical protein
MPSSRIAASASRWPGVAVIRPIKPYMGVGLEASMREARRA